MISTPDNPRRNEPAGPDADPAPDLVARAAAALREHTDAGWVDARERIRSAALTATRRTWPLALQGGDGLYVSDQVIIALLRETVDAIEHVKARAIFITPRDDVVDLLTIEVAVDYDEPIAPLAEEVRRASADLLRELLTQRRGDRPPIDVDVTTVEHI